LSRPELTAQLRDARPSAPPELRERVRLIGAAAPGRPRRITWRRVALVAVPVAVALAAAVLITRAATERHASAPPPSAFERTAGAGASKAVPTPALAPAANAPAVPAPSPSRPQRYSASLELRERSGVAISNATKRATQIAVSLAGYALQLHVQTVGNPGSADLVFRIPRVHVEDAIRRFTALGTIVSEDVSIQDLEPQIASTNDLIARLQRRLGALRAVPQTTATQRQIAALTTRIENLQRSQAATLRVAHYATVELRLTTRTPAPAPAKSAHGPLHGLGLAFHWLWVGAVYVLALGAPLVVVLAGVWLGARRLRRRREDALLSRP